MHLRLKKNWTHLWRKFSITNLVKCLYALLKFDFYPKVFIVPKNHIQKKPSLGIYRSMCTQVEILIYLCFNRAVMVITLAKNPLGPSISEILHAFKSLFLCLLRRKF